MECKYCTSKAYCKGKDDKGNCPKVVKRRK